MAKSKSSASSATRKKHLKKANNDADDAATQPQQQQQQPAQRGQKKVQKKSRFDPKIKVYTPPPATPKGIPDPVDLYLQGGKSVDAELVVVLRKLAKRDESTISKGVEGLEAWIREYLAREKSSSSSKDVDERAKLDQELGSGEQEEAEEEDWIEERRKEEIIESMTVWVSTVFVHKDASSIVLLTCLCASTRLTTFLDWRCIHLDDYDFKPILSIPCSPQLHPRDRPQISSLAPVKLFCPVYGWISRNTSAVGA